MNKTIKIIRKDEKRIKDYEDDYNPNPEECIEIVEKLRQEAMALLYGNTDTFQRTVNVIRRK